MAKNKTGQVAPVEEEKQNITGASQAVQNGTNTKSSQDVLAGIFEGKKLEVSPIQPERVLVPQGENQPAEPIAGGLNAEQQPALPIDAQTATIGSRLGGNSTETLPEQQRPAQSGNEPVAAVRDAATIADTELPDLNDETVIKVDGKLVKVGELRLGDKYADYQRGRWQLTDAQKKLQEQQTELDAQKREIEVQSTTMKAIHGSEFVAAYTGLRMLGRSEEEALAGAAAATGKVIQGAQQAPQGPPKEGTHEYYLQEPEIAGFDPTKDPQKYYDFQLKHVEAIGREGARKEMATLRADFERERQQEQQKQQVQRKAEIAQQTELQQRQERNRELWSDTSDIALKALKGIDTTELTKDQGTLLWDRLVDAGKQLPTPVHLDSAEWTSKNDLTPRSIRELITVADLDPKLFTKPTAQTSSTSTQQPIPESIQESQRRVLNRPISAGPQSASGGGQQVTERKPVVATASQATMNVLDDVFNTAKPRGK